VSFFTNVRRLPKNLIAGVVAGCLAGTAALIADPNDTKAFYAAAVQVVPVFLVALALERTLAEILGTETSVLDEEVARVEREWTPPSRMTRAYYEVGLKLRDRVPDVVPAVAMTEARDWLADRTPLTVARELVSEDNAAEPAFAELVVKLAALATRDRSETGAQRVQTDQLLAEWDNLNGVLLDAARAQATDAVRYTVSSAYRVRRDRQRLSVVTSVMTLAVAETLTFIGLLSPGAPYVGLFAATAAGVAASFVAVTVDAVINLLAPDVDIQSAGLRWPSLDASQSHWDNL
jgi:hypothetical protein